MSKSRPFTFDEICIPAFGAAGYLTTGRKFHPLVLGANQEGAARRSQTFHHPHRHAYDWRVKHIFSAAAEPGEFYLGESGFFAFEFQRAASRLIEMRSKGYLAPPLAPGGSSNAGGPGES